MAVDGSITIGTKLSTQQIDRQIAKLEKDLAKEEEKLKLKITAKEEAEQNLKKHQDAIASLKAEYDKLAPTAQEYYNIVDKINSDQKISASDYNKAISIENTSVIADYEKIKAQLENMEVKENRLKATVEQKNYAYKQTVDRINEYQQKINNLKMARPLAEVEELKNRFNSVGSSIQNAIGKVARLALGIFGIRSAYMLVRRASSDLASYDQQYATNLEYIRYALANAIAPVLRWIVSATATILHYIGIILNSLFGINIFSNSSAKAFTNMKKGASGVSKAVGEIKKQLAGFDEMNVLQDNGNVSAGGGGGGIATPDFDFSNLDRPVPAWLQWIIDHKNEILALLGGIAGGLAFLKLGNIAKDLGLIEGKMLGIKALGFGVMIFGIIKTIQSLIDYLNDPSWENFGKIIQGIGIFIIGLGILIGNVPLIVAGAITLIVGIIIQNWEQIKTFLQNGIDWLTGKSDLVHKLFGDVIGNIYDTFVDTLQILLTFFDNIFKDIRGIFDGLIMFIKGIFTGDWEMAWEGLKTIFTNIWNAIKDFFIMIFGIFEKVFNTLVDTIVTIGKGLWNTIIKLLSDFLNWVGTIFNNIIDGVVWLSDKIWTAITNVIKGIFNIAITIISGIGTFIGNSIDWIINAVKTAGTNVINFFKNVWTGITNIFQNVGTFFGNVFTNAYNSVKKAFSNIKNFFSNIWEGIKSIFSDIGTKVGETIGGAFKKAINSVLRTVENVLNAPINAINNLINVINEVPGINLSKLKTFSLPRLKAGAILNVPNRGTLVGGASAIAGEGGHEGYIPLSDSQAMETLGEAIGRHVVINASVVNNMNGRTISKALQQIQNERDFAYNT